jgi:hypothetical protein
VTSIANPNLYTQTAEQRLVTHYLREGRIRQAAEIQWPGVVLDDFQVDLLQKLFASNIDEVAIKGCTGAGKGASVAMAINLWFDFHPRTKILITSTSAAHAHSVMLAEVVAWRKRMQHPGEGDILKQSIEAHEHKYVRVINPESGEGFSGHHGPATLFVFDEASGVPELFYKLSITQATKIVALSNPRHSGGWFRNLFSATSPNRTQSIIRAGRRRHCMTIAGPDCMNVRLGRMVIPSQITLKKFNDIMADPDPVHRRVYGLAEFPEQDHDRRLIQPSWLERHEAYWAEQSPDLANITAFGLDIAASQYGDNTVLAAGSQYGVHQLYERVWNEEAGDNPADTMQTVYWALQTAHERYEIDLRAGLVPVCVDADGVGKGVADRLHELGVRVIYFRGNALPNDRKRYFNRRAEAYGELSLRLNPAGPFPAWPFGLPPLEKLREELKAPERIYTNDGVKIKITPKHNRSAKSETTLQKILGRSPDRADAVVYLYAAVQAQTVRRPPKVGRDLVWETIPDDDFAQSYSERAGVRDYVSPEFDEIEDIWPDDD